MFTTVTPGYHCWSDLCHLWGKAALPSHAAAAWLLQRKLWMRAAVANMPPRWAMALAHLFSYGASMRSSCAARAGIDEPLVGSVRKIKAGRMWQLPAGILPRLWSGNPPSFTKVQRSLKATLMENQLQTAFPWKYMCPGSYQRHKAVCHFSSDNETHLTSFFTQSSHPYSFQACFTQHNQGRTRLLQGSMSHLNDHKQQQEDRVSGQS